jgi:PleD family two-component response regulator
MRAIFALATVLVAAERVTILHRQLARVRAQLEGANLELLGRSLTDSLTNLGNRRRMEQDLLQVHARALRAQNSYCVTMFDIDCFKFFNDHYGHRAGDQALRQFAASLNRVARTGESVYRHGGEEFRLVMSNSKWRRRSPRLNGSGTSAGTSRSADSIHKGLW